MNDLWNTMSNSRKTFFAVLAVVLLVCIILVITRDTSPSSTEENVPEEKPEVIKKEIEITKKDIKEENFTGSMPVIIGSGALPEAARKYIDFTVQEFRKSANEDVPEMRKQFGVDSPPASYTIDVDAKYLKGTKAQSIVISIYAYTGGANGNSFYKVFTANSSGEILSLKDIIRLERQADFTRLVKSELTAWKGGESTGNTSTVVFEDAVADLTFESFDNWSMDDKNLTLYFDKYEIGPGVLGAVAFPIPLSKLKDLLK